MSNHYQIASSLGMCEPHVGAALADLARSRLVERIWAKDYRVWKPDPTEITDRLGWLRVPEQMKDRLSHLRGFARSIQDAGFRDVVLLGMGGSSLGPEVLRRTFGSSRGSPRLWVLDSTVPGAVRQVSQAIKPAKTLYILASKSGGTIEVMSLFAHFWHLTTRAKGNNGGAQFIAVTDHGTSLATLAQERGFRSTFVNPSDIGGRYSVLSYFGLVPAALMGIDVELLLARAAEMAAACAPPHLSRDNPGAYLGVVMGVLGRDGRDKITIVGSPQVRSFGLWAEQLLAESTGKEEKGLIPVAEEPLLPPEAYGDDRVFVYLRLEGDANGESDRHVKNLEKAGHPVLSLTLRDRYDLAAEFYRWEFATAVAGYYLSIHPFDQPNVQESKQNTSRILEEVRRRGRLPEVQADDKVQDLLAQAGPGKYVSLLAYVTPSAKVDAAVEVLRKAIMSRHRLATTAGYGPRYLHSTGQLHKGGPNNGLFIQCVETMTPDVKIPDESYTFGVLAQAQAIGDLQSLQAHHRTVVRVPVGRNPAQTIRSLVKDSRRRPRARPPRRPAAARRRS